MSIIISLERIKERRKKLTQTNVSVAVPIFIFRIWHTFGEQGGGRGKEGGETKGGQHARLSTSSPRLTLAIMHWYRAGTQQPIFRCAACVTVFKFCPSL